ncbi:MAG: sensor histidine kinase [Phycisphaerae bacterium]|nr:sensor histidine kinase [Saprospiraceae bacterium]
MLLLVFVLIAFFLLSQRKLQQARQKAYAIELEQREQRLYGTIQIQENERQRIAKDLHDSIGSKLNVLHLYLHRLKKQVPSTPLISETVQDIFEVINTTLDTTRRISHDLLPPTLEKFGLKAALNEACTQYAKSSDTLQIDFASPHEPYPRHDKMAELNLFRVMQELFSNSIKHGPATHIRVEMQYQNTKLHIYYSDNGPGFDPAADGYKPGLGLQNIESRMNMIGAQYALNTAPSKGLEVQITYQPTL